MTELNTPVRIGESMDWRYIYDATGKEILKVAFDYKGSLKALEELIRRANAYDEAIKGLEEIKSFGHGSGHGCGFTCANKAEQLLNKLTNEER